MVASIFFLERLIFLRLIFELLQVFVSLKHTDQTFLKCYVLKIFLDQNIDLNVSDYSGRTIKDMAEQSRDKRILKMLN